MYLPLTHGHTMYYEVHGVRDGPTAVVLHGGPGAGLSRTSLRMFNLKRWRVVLYDQRGCGRSTPFGVDSLAHNRTADLLEDIERLRVALGVHAWYLTGGSWGSTLALLYAEAHPTRVFGMLLRSVCLTDRKESAWLYEPLGAAQVFPDAYAKFLSVLPASTQRGSMETILRSYKRLLASPNMRVRDRAAAAWTGYEDAVISLLPAGPVGPQREPVGPQRGSSGLKPLSKADVSVAILENHYFLNNAWLRPGQILDNAHRIRHIPLDVIHGRYDMICPYRSIQALAAVLPNMRVLRVDDGGHSGYGPVIVQYGRHITDGIVGSLKGITPSKRHTRKKTKELQ
jgi:proline iminopeptidase